MNYDQKKQEHDEMMTRIRAEINGNDPREAVIADLRAQLATAQTERDDYRSKFRDLEHELQLERGQVVTVTQRAEAAEAALHPATNSTPGKSTGVWVPLDKWQELHAQLAAAERFGADQWRRGNAGKEPQELDEWRREQS